MIFFRNFFLWVVRGRREGGKKSGVIFSSLLTFLPPNHLLLPVHLPVLPSLTSVPLSFTCRICLLPFSLLHPCLSPSLPSSSLTLTLFPTFSFPPYLPIFPHSFLSTCSLKIVIYPSFAPPGFFILR